jgi:tRNA(fMet)-specific endonuclease VapC
LVSRYLVDTDWVIDALNERAEALQTLESLAPDGLAISLITYGELYEGVHYARDPSTARSALQDLLGGFDVLAVTQEIAERFAIIRGGLTRHLRRQIGDLDLLIAATAIQHDLMLVTRNLRDFQHIPDLRIHEPTPA